jgi:hypothetical protein
MPSVTLVRKDSAGWVGHFGDVFLQAYTVPAPVELVRERHQAERAFIDMMQPKRIITGTIVHEPAIVRPSDELRAATTEHSKSTVAVTRAGFLVILAPGFKAAMLRGIVASLMLFTGAGYPFKVAASEIEAFDWLGTHLDKSMTKADLIRAYDDLRAR